MYIYVYPSAYGKVPHVVAERDLHGWGFQRRLARYEILEGTKCCQKGTKGCQKEPKGTQNGAKGRQREPKGTQGAPKGNQGEPKGIQKSAWAPGSILNAKTGAFPIPIWIQLWTIFPPKRRSKIDAKTDVEKHEFQSKSDTKRVPKSMPKRIKNQCQNWYRKRSGKSSKIMFL